MLPTRKEVADRLKAGMNLVMSMLFLVIAVLGAITFAGWMAWEMVAALGIWVLYGLFGLFALLLCVYALGQIALAKGWEMTAEQKMAEKKARRATVTRQSMMPE